MAKHPPKSGAASLVTASSAPLPRKAVTLYREVLQAMNERGIPYAVAGAFALQKYTGIRRLTKDLDLFLKPEDVSAALDHLCKKGFRCETLDPVWLSKARRGEYFVDLISGMSNAVIMVDDTWIQRAQPTVIAGVQSQILSAEDLLASKLFVTRRERFDGADIAHIIYRTKGRLEWERILDRPLQEICRTLEANSEEGKRLRQNSPFAQRSRAVTPQSVSKRTPGSGQSRQRKIGLVPSAKVGSVPGATASVTSYGPRADNGAPLGPGS